MRVPPRLAHAWRRVMRAQQRYEDANGDIYAAGITYFTIFAMFPLLMIGFAVVGFVLAGRPQLLADIDNKVKAAVPGDFGQQVISLMDSAIDSRTSVGIIGLGTAIYIGLLWMQRLRAAVSQMWGQDFPSPGFLNTKFSDVRALVAAFVASILTIGLSAMAGSALQLAGVLRVGSVLGSILVAWLLFTSMIARLPHYPMPLRRCAWAGLLAAVGFESFKQAASIYLRTVMHGPAGTAFGPVLGLMVFAYMTARLVLFATAWAATTEVSEPGPVDSATVPPSSG
ncbi:MAG: inner membrane protein YhjD [Mycobacterium sp.]